LSSKSGCEGGTLGLSAEIGDIDSGTLSFGFVTIGWATG
jgi:hypothetical protein